MHGSYEQIDRPTTAPEREFLRQLLKKGFPEAYRFIPQIDEVRVIAQCFCGCAAVKFVPDQDSARLILAQKWLDNSFGGRIGVLVYALGERLAGVDLTSTNWTPEFREASELSVLSALPTVRPNKALQTDKVKQSCLSHSQKPRQLAFAAELGR